MSNMDRILTMLVEETTTEISRSERPAPFGENRSVAKAGGEVARNAREDIERRTGKSVITSKNATQLNQLVTNVLDDLDNKGNDF